MIFIYFVCGDLMLLSCYCDRCYDYVKCCKFYFSYSELLFIIMLYVVLYAHLGYAFIFALAGFICSLYLMYVFLFDISW